MPHSSNAQHKKKLLLALVPHIASCNEKHTSFCSFSCLCPRAPCVPHSTNAQHSAHSNLLANSRAHIAAMQSTQHLVRSVPPCLLRATYTAPAHNTQHTTICSLRASVPAACQKAATQSTVQFVRSCASVPACHIAPAHSTQKLLALVLYTQHLVRSRPVASCHAPIATHDTHNNLFARALWPRA